MSWIEIFAGSVPLHAKDSRLIIGGARADSRNGETLSAVHFGSGQAHPEKDEFLIPAGILEKNAREVMS